MTKNERRTTRQGFILLLTLIFMTVLTVMAGTMMYMMTYESRSSNAQVEDSDLTGLADAGIEKAHRAIRDDYLTTTSQGTADLRGADTSLSVSVGSPNNMRYIDTADATINNDNDQAIIRTFDSNYTNTRLISIELHVRADSASGGEGSTIQVSYTTDGATYAPVLTQALTTTLTDYSANLPVSLSWSTLMSPNFRIRIIRIAGNRAANIESIFLRVAYGMDSLKEDWATGDYATFPISLGSGTIESVVITNEESKVHLNYASQALLDNLFANLGISSASAKAANVVNYRGSPLTDPFDSVEELQQVSGITASDYNIIKNYITTYSTINTNSYRPAGPRAPVNINTAPFEALKAVFDPINLAAGNSTNLANDIITFRNSTPFTCFYSSNAAVTTDFYDFIYSRAYLTNAQRNRVLDNCDPSSLIPVSGYAGYSCASTELCYAGYTFYADCLANAHNRNFRVKTIIGNDGSHAFTHYAGDTAASGWRKENFE